MLAHLAIPLPQYGLPAGAPVEIVHETRAGLTFDLGGRRGFVLPTEIEMPRTAMEMGVCERCAASDVSCTCE